VALFITDFSPFCGMFSVVDKWNSLSDTCVNSNTINTFKTQEAAAELES